MRIGLLTTSFPTSVGDIAGHFVLGFARALAARGHTVEVLAPAPAEPGSPPRLHGIELTWVRYLWPSRWQRTFYGAGVLDNLRGDARTALGLAPFIGALSLKTARRIGTWDAVVSHWALPCALVAGALKRSGTPHLAVLHSADVFLLERLPGRRQLASRIVQDASALLFVSRELRARFLSLLSPLSRGRASAKAHVCAMGIDPVVNLDPREPKRSGPLQLLSLGRLIRLKGVHHLIDAVSSLPSVQLAIAGDGPERAALEKQAKRLGAPVRFVGQLSGRAKHGAFAAADAFVLPSQVMPTGRSEGVPTTLLEAMEHGLPVIASRVGGVADVVVPSTNGILVQPASAASLREAIGQLRSPELREQLARGARETAAMYHWDVLAPHFEDLLRGDECQGAVG